MALAAANPKTPMLRKLAGWPVVSVIAVLFLGFGFTASLTDEYGMAIAFYAIGIAMLLVKFLLWEETKRYSSRKKLGINLLAVIVALQVFCGGLWINHLRKLHVEAKQTPIQRGPQLPPPVRGDYMESRGPTDLYGTVKIVRWKVVKGIASSDVVADGNLLTEYADKFRLIALCLHLMPQENYLDSPKISKSGVLDIRRGLIPLTIPWSEQFIHEVGDGERGTKYVLLLVPKSMKSDDFNTEREAISMGAYELQASGGQP